MKYIYLFSLLFICNLIHAQKIKLQEATPVKVKIKNEISSKTAQVGDVIEFQLAEALYIDSNLVIDTTAVVVGEVIVAEASRSLGRAGKLDFMINNVKAVDGQIIQLRAQKNITGKETTGGVIAAAVLVSPLFLFVKGKNVKIEQGREFMVYVAKEYEIEAAGK